MPPVEIAQIDIPESLRKRIAQAVAAMPVSNMPLEYYCLGDGHRVHKFNDGYQCRICGKKFALIA